VKVVVDFDVCASTGACMQVCPEVFEVRTDGYLYVLQEEPPEELRDKVTLGMPLQSMLSAAVEQVVGYRLLSEALIISSAFAAGALLIFALARRAANSPYQRWS